MLLRLVHGEEDLTFIKPVKPGERTGQKKQSKKP
jgi:acyl dehydratase